MNAAETTPKAPKATKPQAKPTAAKKTAAAPKAPAKAKAEKPAKVAAPKPAKAPKATPEVKTKGLTKNEVVIGLLGRPQGASLQQMQDATGWQAHSVRGFLATLKKRNLSTTNEKVGDVRIYKLVTPAADPAEVI